MTTEAQRDTALKNWIRSVTKFDAAHVIKRNAGGPRPSGAYAVFDSPVPSKRVGTVFVSGESVSEGALTRVHTKLTEVRSGIDIYGNEAPGLFESLELSVCTSVNRGILFAGDLTFIRRNTVVYVPEYGDTEPRDRYRADFYFYTQYDFVETDYELQQVTAELEFEDDEENKMTVEMTVGETDE